MNYDVCVIGGGASGMMAAITASNQGKSVLILEKNSVLGKKLSITGGGRCNITNAEFDIHALLPHYGEAKPFLFSPFSQFGVKDTFDFFESRGLPLEIEDRKRAFPKSRRASDVVSTLERSLHDSGVTCSVGEEVIRIEKVENQWSIKTLKTTYFSHSLIIATGGTSHGYTGSTGDGFKFLKKQGHTIVAPTPSLVPLNSSFPLLSHLAGVTLASAKIIFSAPGEKKTLTGPILFTHTGISGPTIINSAGIVKDMMHTGDVYCIVNSRPDVPLSELEAECVALFQDNPNKSVSTVLKLLFRFGSTEFWKKYVLHVYGDISSTPVHSITKEVRKSLLSYCSNISLRVTSLASQEHSIVADGGIPLSEIDTKRMSSKFDPCLFVVGDLLHIRRPSGGYSLQLCWTSGYVAGKNA